MAIEHPRSANEITREWIAYALQEARVCKSTQVTGIEVESLGSEISGFLSSICRVSVAYDSPGPELPESFVIKLPPADGINREYAARFQANERELRFYRQIAPSSPIRVPKCYYTVMDEETDNYILVLEDEKDWTVGNQVQGLSRSQVEAAVRAISHFHAYWWDSPGLKSLDWMPHEYRDIRHSFAEQWPEFKEEHRDVLSGRDIEAGNLISVSGGK